MKINKIIKTTILSEVAGISFETRAWAKIIEKYVSDYVKAEREKMATQAPKTPSPQPQNPKNFSWSAPLEDEKDDYNYKIGYTHFENEAGEPYEEANVYGDELVINSDVLYEFPGIKREVSGKLFNIKLDGQGSFFIDTVESEFPEKFRIGIEEVIEDHMLNGEAFYTNDYELVYAVNYDDDTYGSYMTESAYGDYGYQGGYGGYGGYGGNYIPQPKIDKIEINGKDFPEAYENFKVDKWVLTSSNRIEYDHWKSGYNEEGEYVVYLNMPMGSIGGSILVHEIKHAYDDWNRMSRGAKPIRDGWEIKNIYTKDFEKLVLGGGAKYGQLNPIIKNYYLGSKLEAPAYLENEYDNAGFNYKQTAKTLMNFKASNFLNKEGKPAKGLQDMWTDLLIDYNIPLFRKFPDVVDFLNYTEKYFNKRGTDIFKRINKMRYVHDKPEPKPYTPKPYTAKPVTTVAQTAAGQKPVTTNIPQTSGTGSISTTLASIDKSINDLDTKIDSYEEMWQDLYNEDSKGNVDRIKKLDVYLDKLYDERDKLVDQWNDLKSKNRANPDDLPF